jgi:hypothetical protein
MFHGPAYPFMGPSKLRDVIQEPLVSKGLKESRAELLQRVQALKKVNDFSTRHRRVCVPAWAVDMMVTGSWKTNRSDNHKSQRMSLTLIAWMLNSCFAGSRELAGEVGYASQVVQGGQSSYTAFRLF